MRDRGGWFGAAASRAASGAALAAAAGLALAEAAVFVFRAAGGGSAPVGGTARAGGLAFMAFHGVPVAFDASLRPLGSRPGGAVTVQLGAVPMLGTLVVAVGLFLAARALVRRASRDRPLPSPSVRGLQGTLVAVPYALIALAVAVASRLTLAASGTSRVLIVGQVAVRPSFPEAILWPAAIAVAAGFLGGVSASGRVPSRRVGQPVALGFGPPEPSAVERRPDTPLEAAVAGGGAMAGLALALAFGGLLVLAVADGPARRAYLDEAFGHGGLRGGAAAGLTLMAVPNMATWVLAPSMGSCITVSRSLAGAAQSGSATCELSYTRFPRTGAVPGLIGSAGPGPLPSHRGRPTGDLLFVLVPLIAVLAGGWIAAVRARAGGLAANARAGALAGVVFGAIVLVLVVLARLTATIGGPGAAAVGGAQSLSAGPAVLVSAGLALVWGIAGGCLGGSFRALLRPGPAEQVRERVFPAGAPAPVPETDP